MSQEQTWDRAESVVNDIDRREELRRAILKATDEEFEHPTGIAPPPRPALVIVDRFDPTMVEADGVGACIKIRQLQRSEVMQMITDLDPPIMSLDERSQSILERHTGTQPTPRPMVAPGASLIVMTPNQRDWNTPRWHLIEYVSDGDGCVP